MKAISLPLGKTPSFLLPAFYLGIILTYDWVESFQTISPSMLSIGLLLWSFLIRPSWMLWWATIYSVIVVEILVNPGIFAFFSGGNYPHETTSHHFRAINFVVTAAFACLFSWMLTRLHKKRDVLHNLIQQMPIPVIVSDIEGKIVELNEQARALIGIAGDDLFPNFFDAFAPASRQGKCISSYLSFFEQGTTKKSRLEIEYDGLPISAHVELIASRPRQLITMITSEVKSRIEHQKP